MSDAPTFYLVPGLGCDARLFIPLQDQGIRVVPLPFIPPHKNDTIQSYAARMAEPLMGKPDLLLGGVSFGGVIAREMSVHLNPKSLLLISTVKRSSEFPPYFRFGRYLPMHRAIPAGFMMRFGPRQRGHGMRPETRKLMDAMRNEADPKLVAWSIHALIHWRQENLPSNYAHIHGVKDALLPARFIENYHPVADASHGLVLTHPKVLAEWMLSVAGGGNR